MSQSICSTHRDTHTLVLTGVKEDHGLEADVLLPLQLELSHPRRGGYQHIKDLGEALHAAPLFSGVRNKTYTVVQGLLRGAMLGWTDAVWLQWMRMPKGFWFGEGVYIAVSTHMRAVTEQC